MPRGANRRKALRRLLPVDERTSDGGRRPYQPCLGVDSRRTKHRQFGHHPYPAGIAEHRHLQARHYRGGSLRRGMGRNNQSRRPPGGAPAEAVRHLIRCADAMRNHHQQRLTRAISAHRPSHTKSCGNCRRPRQCPTLASGVVNKQLCRTTTRQMDCKQLRRIAHANHAAVHHLFASIRFSHRQHRQRQPMCRRRGIVGL